MRYTIHLLNLYKIYNLYSLYKLINLLYINGRDKNTTISGGEKINSNYVKDILLTHKFIESVVVKVIKNSEWGESIEANVVLNSSEITEDEIIDNPKAHD